MSALKEGSKNSQSKNRENIKFKVNLNKPKSQFILILNISVKFILATKCYIKNLNKISSPRERLSLKYFLFFLSASQQAIKEFSPNLIKFL